MAPKSFLGEFEQMVLLSVLRLGERAFGVEARRELERVTGRRVSRGAFYTTLDRLTQKDFLKWEVEETGTNRGGLPRRRFEVTRPGIRALTVSRNALVGLWNGLEPVLGDAKAVRR